MVEEADARIDLNLLCSDNVEFERDSNIGLVSLARDRRIPTRRCGHGQELVQPPAHPGAVIVDANRRPGVWTRVDHLSVTFT